MKQYDLIEKSSNLGIDWCFSPPSGPHFGGVLERPVQSAKRPLYAVLKDRTPTDETLYTLLTEVEAFLKARRLTHVNPNHFRSCRSTHTAGHFMEGELASRKS